MRSIRKIGFFIPFSLILVFIVSGCSDSSTKTETGSGTVKVAYRDVTSGFPNLRYEKAGDFVFRSRSKMAAHVKAHSVEMSSSESLPDVDFEKDMVVLIAVGARSSAGYRVLPVSVRAEGDKTLVKVKERSPPPDSIAASVITYPFVALVVEKRQGPIEVKVENRN